MKSMVGVDSDNMGDFEVWPRRSFKTSETCRKAGKTLKRSLGVMEGYFEISQGRVWLKVKKKGLGRFLLK